MVKVSFRGKTLNISQGQRDRELEFEDEVGDAQCRDNKVFVRFKAIGDKSPDRNIICVNLDGKVLWRVQDPDQWRTGKKYYSADIYVGMGFYEDGSLWASGGQSSYRIDVATGKILEEVYTK